VILETKDVINFLESVTIRELAEIITNSISWPNQYLLIELLCRDYIFVGGHELEFVLKKLKNGINHL